MNNHVINSFLVTKEPFDAHMDYPKLPGLYAVSLANNASLEDFGHSGTIIYIGIAKKSLYDRDFDQHFKAQQTGRSALRRALGAILKERLSLLAIPRGGPNDSKRFDCFKFTVPGEETLTSWMKKNLEIGYWVPDRKLTYRELRDEEKEITIELKPTLDQDNRTGRYNPLAKKLKIL